MPERDQGVGSVGGRHECVICAHGGPLDVLVELPATWATAPARAPLPGYVCVVSRIHVVEPYELRDERRRAFWDDVSAVAEAVQTATAATKLNYEIHGNTVPHLHLHLYPRYPGDPYEGGPIAPASGHVFERSAADLDRLRGAIARRFDLETPAITRGLAGDRQGSQDTAGSVRRERS